MKHWLAILFAVLMASVGSISVSYAVNLETYQFDDPNKEALFRELINELRCPKCQNQSIADSDAPLAKDLRDRTYLMVQQGARSEEHTSELQSRPHLVCRLLLEKKKK